MSRMATAFPVQFVSARHSEMNVSTPTMLVAWVAICAFGICWLVD